MKLRVAEARIEELQLHIKKQDAWIVMAHTRAERAERQAEALAKALHDVVLQTRIPNPVTVGLALFHVSKIADICDDALRTHREENPMRDDLGDVLDLLVAEARAYQQDPSREDRLLAARLAVVRAAQETIGSSAKALRARIEAIALEWDAAGDKEAAAELRAAYREGK